MAPGGMAPPPLTPFNPRTQPPLMCVTGPTSGVASAIQYDPFAKALVAVLPKGLIVADVRYSVYPAGGSPAWGQACVIQSTDEDGVPIRAVVWLLATNATFPADAKGNTPPPVHTNWSGGRDLYIETEDTALSALLVRALSDAAPQSAE
jgi:hypothetical protein